MIRFTSSCLPAHVHHGPPKPIPTSEALAHVQSYLTRTLASPHLHPDCIFIERQGPTFASNAGIGNVVIHQLRRVEAGLRGIYIADVVDEIDVDGASAQEKVVGQDKHINGPSKSYDERLDAQIKEYEALHHEPQTGMGTAEEFGNYQEQLREQGETDTWGEIGDRSHAVRNRDSVPEVRSTATPKGQKRGREQPNAVSGKGVQSKKMAKKERMKEDKAQRADERRARQVDNHDNQNSRARMWADALKLATEEGSMVVHEDNMPHNKKRRSTPHVPYDKGKEFKSPSGGRVTVVID